MEFLCKIDDFGRIVLSEELRAALGAESGDEFAVSFDQQHGELLVRKAAKRCLLCDSTESLTEMTAGYFLCASCSACLR